MRKLIIENFRCFGALQEAELRPLTLLVGENSSGKSAFLAAMRVISELARYNMDPDFNAEPFQLGAYNQIAHFRGGRGGRAKNFTLGFETVTDSPPLNLIRMTVTFREVRGQPQAAAWLIQSGHYRVSISVPQDSQKLNVALQSPGEKRVSFSADVEGPPGLFRLGLFPMGEWRWALHQLLFGDLRKDDPIQTMRKRFGKKDMAVFRKIIAPTRLPTSRRTTASAPIRSKPQRTYNPIRYTPEPTGGHVPMVLSKVSGSDKKRWGNLLEELSKFGVNAGLFDSLQIKALGRTGSDPFQLLVRVFGPYMNLVDVGYGVSQALPLLVDALLAAPQSTFLIQEPEVHLHPRAQAELGTFFGRLVKKYQHRFVVETHSDYLIDRIRMDVRDGRFLSPKDVIILFFQKEGASATIFPVEVDQTGNIVGQPEKYREFFLQEEGRFFGA